MGSISIALMAILSSTLFFAISTFGIQNSSVCAVEKQANSFKEDNGSDIRMRLYLSEESEGKRKSIINPLNSFNDYRITEFGRCGSYVLDKQFNIIFAGGVSISNQILYSDYYSEYFTTNRINLTSTKFDKNTFYDKHSIYVTRSIVDQIPNLKVGDVIGQTVKLSIDEEEEEFVVRGVIESNSVKNNGKIFSTLFSECFVVMCSPMIYKFDFTDLLFQSPDYYFVDDFSSFESSFSKTYLNFNDIKLRTCALYDSQIVLSEIFTIPTTKTVSNIVISVFSIIGLILIAVIYLGVFIVYDFNVLSRFEKVTVCSVSIVWSFVPMMFGLFMMMRDIFLSRLVISLLIGFAAVSLIAIVAKFSFFKSKEEMVEVEYDK